MNNETKKDLISKIPNNINWNKEIEIQIDGYFNKSKDVNEEGIIYNVYPPFSNSPVCVSITWDDLKDLNIDYEFDEEDLIRIIEDKINLY